MRIQRLGPYKIRRRIGRGGMGTVLEGVNEETGEAAAIKVLSAALAGEEGFRDRFHGEIESLRKLRHPNIVRLYGFGEQDDILFYAMELVRGLSLEEELESGRRFNWREATQIGIQVCRALKHAHDRGVIHRDLKPGNLLLTDDASVKLSDFGIAKLFGHNGQTAAGGVLGTAEYMAPEQADGRPVTIRSDLYSLGGVLFALLARRAPFRAQTLPEMLQLQRYAEPDPVRRYAPDAPAEMERIIAQLLEKDPQQRMPTALVVMRRLEAMHHALSVAIGKDSSSGEAPDPFIATSPTVTAAESLEEIARREGAKPLELGDARRPPADVAATDADPVALDPPERDELDDDGPAVDVDVSAAPPFDVRNDQAESQSPQAASMARFTTVPEDDQVATAPLTTSDAPIFSMHTAALVAGLLAVGWGAWWFLQPPNPDAVYARVVAAAKEDLDALVGVEDELDYLLDQHHTSASDARRAELLVYRERIELDRLDRRLERRARRSTDEASLLPVERAYLEALRWLEIDSSRGVDRLKSVIDLYDDGSEASPATRRCLELARRRLQQFEQQVSQFSEDDMAMLEARLERAEQISADDPDRARRMWRAIVEIYKNKPWASAAVERAQRQLAQTERPIETIGRR